MGQRVRPAPLLDGAACTACGAPIPGGRIRIVARREDLAFVQLACPACGSATLGLLMTASEPDVEPILDVDTDGPGTPVSRTPSGRAALRPIREADVVAMRRDLADWEGDLVGWLERLERGDRRGSVGEG